MKKIKRILLPFLLVMSCQVQIPSLTAQTVFGFAGKPYNPVTGLYDFGYRDYSPETGRFTTEDPIKDSLNWYSYTDQDPVNFVDLVGLKNVGIISHSVMTIGTWALNKLTGSDALIKSEGCAITWASNVMYSQGIDMSPDVINEKYVSGGDLNWDAMAAGEGMSAERIRSNYTVTDWLKQDEDEKNRVYTGIQVPYTAGGDEHWVGVEGVKVIDDVNYFVVSGTSLYDCPDTILQNRLDAGWVKKGDEVLVPETLVKGAIVMKKPKSY